jgi:hypothetical protein
MKQINSLKNTRKAFLWSQMVEKSKGFLSAHTIVGRQVQDFNVKYWIFTFPKIMADTLKS